MPLKEYELIQLRNTINLALRKNNISKKTKARADYEFACNLILPPLHLSPEKEQEAKRVIKQYVGL